MSDNYKNIQKHESPVRKMLADSHGTKYEALETLEEARKLKNAYLIMEGDDGGQIYLVAPVEMIKCDQGALETVLQDLDARAWNDISMAGLYYEVHKPDSVISGGMGGGRTKNGLWVHKEFDDIKDRVQKVIDGSAQSIHV